MRFSISPNSMGSGYHRRRTSIGRSTAGEEAALVADVTAPDDPEPVVTGRKPLKLDVPEVVEIDEELRDED